MNLSLSTLYIQRDSIIDTLILSHFRLLIIYSECCKFIHNFYFILKTLNFVFFSIYFINLNE